MFENKNKQSSLGIQLVLQFQERFSTKCFDLLLKHVFEFS